MESILNIEAHIQYLRYQPGVLLDLYLVSGFVFLPAEIIFHNDALYRRRSRISRQSYLYGTIPLIGLPRQRRDYDVNVLLSNVHVYIHRDDSSYFSSGKLLEIYASDAINIYTKFIRVLIRIATVCHICPYYLHLQPTFTVICFQSTHSL